MSIEIIKWLNSFSKFPVGKFLFDYSSENSGYSNLTELVFNIADSVGISYVTVRTRDLEREDHNQMPINYLCYNAAKEIIDSDSVTYAKTFEEAKNYDYLVILDPEENISLKSKHLFYLLTKYSHTILISIGFALSLLFQFSYMNLILLLQCFVIYLLNVLAFQNNNKAMSSICRIGNKKDSCIELQKESGLVFRYFSFSEAGLIYFYGLFLWTVAIIISTSFASTNFILFHFGLIFIFTYSVIKQLENKIYCPVCIFTDVIIIIQFMVIFFNWNMSGAFNFSLSSLLLLLLTLFTTTFFVTLKKLLIHYQKEAFKSDYTIKELIISNSNFIASNFKKVETDTTELMKSAFKQEVNSLKEKILFCININCPSCISMAYKMRFLVNSKFDPNLAFQVDNIKRYNSKSPIIQDCIYLSIIFEEIGISEFSKSIIALNVYDNKLDLFQRILNKHGISVDSAKIKKIWNRLIEQNKIFDKQSIVEFPYIVKNDKLIAPYINPKYYEVVL